jgi:carbonic anhydrase
MKPAVARHNPDLHSKQRFTMVSESDNFCYKLAVAPARFYAFDDVQQNVREQVQKVRSHPWIPQQVTVRGFVNDVKSGRLKEVTEAELRRVT